MKKRVFFAVLALFSFAAFFSCSNAAGGSDSESSKPSSASASKKPGYVTLTGTVSVSGAVPKILSDNYDPSSDNDGVSRSAQPGINTSGSEATMEYFARATSGDLVSEGVFGTGAEAKMFGLELQAGIEWTIVVGVREKSTSKPIPERTVYLSSTWKVTPDPAAPTISHNFVPVPNTSGETGSIALKINYSPSLYEITPKFVDGPDSVNLDALNFDYDPADGGRIYKWSSIPSGKYELCLEFKTTTSPQVLVYSTIQSVTVANGMQTDSWVADSSSSAVSPISAAGEFKFDSSAGGNAQALMSAFLGTNLFVGKVSDDCAAPDDTNSGNYLSPLKTVTGAVRKIAAAGNSNADYVIRVSGKVEGTNSASPAVIQAISTSNAKSLTIIGTSGSDTDCIKSASSQAPAVSISTNVPITFKKIKIMGSKSGAGPGEAINAFGGSKVTIDEGSLITGGKVGVNVTGDSTKVTMTGGSFSGNDADVYLESGKVLTVDCNLSNVADKGIVVSLASWTRGTQFIEAGASLGTLSGAIVGKFDFTTPGWDTPTYDSDKKAKIDADIYVAANGVDKDSENVENTIGNKNYPFASIKQASKYLDASHGTIYVSGSVSGAQEIPASVASTCTAIKLTGLNPLPTSGTSAYVPSDEINAGGAARAGTALTVATSVPVTIENLKITGGNSGTSYTGGGISVNAGSVTLSDGAWVSGNLANGNVNCGGGVYVKSEAKLFMRGKSLVGDKSAATNESGANNLEIGEGGGICNEGSVYIGCNESGVAETGYALADGYGVRGNWSNQGGAGIANLGTLIIASGEISYNATDYNAYSEGWGAVSTPGGGVYNKSGSLTINGGKIYANKSTDGGGIYLKGGSAVMNGGTIGGDTTDMSNVAAGKGLSSGGGLVINTSCEFKMLGGTISHNSAKNLGGAVSASGTFTMSGGIISENEVNGLGDVHGGAVYVNGTFNLSGSAYIPSGVKNNSGVLVSGTGKNDVYLYNGRTVTVTGTLSPTTTGAAGGTAASVCVGALTPNEYKRGKKIVLAESGVSVNENLWKKIVLADNDGDWTKFKKTENAGETTEKNYVAITADVFVAGSSSTEVSGVTYGKGLATTEGGLGTKSKPFKFISDAVAVFEDASSPAVVTIVGTTYPVAQEIPDTFTTTSNASALTLKGLSSSSIGTIKRFTNPSSETASDTGSALKVNSTVPVTIQDITITGGKTSGNGGGINIAKTGASVTLSSGAKVTGNTAVNGGGVYVAASQTLALIGSDASPAEVSQNTVEATDTNAGGGGIYNAGTVSISGSAKINQNTAKVSCSTKNSVAFGGGVYNDKGTLKTESNGSLEISGNKAIGVGTSTSYSSAAYGGGVYNSISGSVTVTSATSFAMDGNSATVTNASGTINGQGGAIYNIGGTVDLSLGNIGTTELNTSTVNGGAIYVGGTVKLGGSVCLYNANNAAAKNDIFLPNGMGDTTIDVAYNISTSGKVATITQQKWKRGSVVLAGTYAASYYSKFEPSDKEWSVGYNAGGKWTLNDDLKTRVGADIYVAGSSGRADGIGAPDTDSNGALGTKAKPYDSIEEAVKQCWNSSLPFTIKFSGTIKDKTQTIPAGNSTQKTGLASAITIEGFTGNSSDIINRNLSSVPTSGGSALTISTSTPVTLKKIKITGGYSKNNGGGILVNGVKGASLTLSTGANVTANTASSNGGGVYFAGTSASGGTANLIMDSTAQIGGNTASSNGGGVYLSYANLCMSGNALIGDTSGTSHATSANNGYSNKATNGAGVYIANSGSSVWLGYAQPSDADISKSTLSTTYGIRHNYASTSGGGIYNMGGSITFDTGEISFNGTAGSASSGGGISIALDGTTAGVLNLKGGKIKGNYSYDGGGVYSEGKIVMTGGTIGDITYPNEGVGQGGGVTSTNRFTMSGGLIGDDSTSYIAKNQTGNYANKSAKGAGLCLSSSQNTYVSITSGSIEYNYATSSGGGIYLGSGWITIGCNIARNGAYNGGGVYSSDYDFTLKNAEFASNKADNAGGACYLEAKENNRTITFDGSTSIPSSAAKNNDVYLNSDVVSGKLARICGSPGTMDGTDIVATITPSTYTSRVVCCTSSNNISVVAEIRRFAITPQSSQTWGIGDNGYLKTIIGTKSKPTAVGDIVFSDGSARPYEAGMTLTTDQQNKAIAFTIYAGKDCNNEGETGNRYLAVGRAYKNNNTTCWCITSANAHTGVFNSIACSYSGSYPNYTFSGVKNGKDNFTRLKTALAGNDDTGTPSNYPGFNFGNNYKTQTNSNVSGTSYESGWYLPSMVELFYFYKNLTTINASAALYGITYPGTALLSSSLPDNSSSAVCYFASNGQPYTNSNRQDTRGAIAIHEF